MTLRMMWFKSIVRFPIDIRRAESLLLQARPREQNTPLPGRAIVLEMRTPQLQFDCGRHLNAIAIHAKMISSPFYLRCSRVLFAAIARKLFGPELLTDNNLTWLAPTDATPDDALVLHDSIETLPSNLNDDRCTHSQLMIGRDTIDGSWVMPYPMHPHTLSRLAAVDMTALRGTPDRCGIFFAGRLKANYTHVRNHFGVMNRLEMIESLRANFAPQVTDRIDIASHKNSIVLVDAKTQGLSSEDWLPTLASFNFFVCCPGVCQPMCHNAVEAMSVGTIPLIEYADRFSPALVDGVNAICFSGPQGLIDAVKRIQRLSAVDIDRLRRGVVAYYETHLRGDRFLAKLRDTSERVSLVSMPFHDTNFFRERKKTAA